MDKTSTNTAMIKIYAWRARRAGGRITIKGKTGEGADIRVANVETITAGDLIPTAIDKDGVHYLLFPENALRSAA